MSNVNEWWAEEEGEDGIVVEPDDKWDFDISKSVLISSVCDIMWDGGPGTGKLTLPTDINLTPDEGGVITNYRDTASDGINIIESEWGSGGTPSRKYSAVKLSYTFQSGTGSWYTDGVYPFKDRWMVVSHQSSYYYVSFVDAPAGGLPKNLQTGVSTYFLRTGYRPCDAVMVDGLVYVLCHKGYGKFVLYYLDVNGNKYGTVSESTSTSAMEYDYGARLDPSGRFIVTWGRYTPNGGSQTIRFSQYEMSKPFDLATSKVFSEFILPSYNGTSYAQGLEIGRSGKWMVFGKYSTNAATSFETYSLSK